LFVAFIILIAGVLWFVPDVEVNLSYDRAYDSFTGGLDTTQPTLLSEPSLTHTDVPSLEPGNVKVVKNPPVLIKPPSANASSPASVKLPTLEEQKQNNSAAIGKIRNEFREKEDEPLIFSQIGGSESPATTEVDEENERRRQKIIEVSGCVLKLRCTNRQTRWMYLCLKTASASPDSQWRLQTDSGLFCIK